MSLAQDAYDSIVIGSGQGGNPLCGALAGRGGRVALVERDHIGGCCINEGCTPTKTMVASARVAYLIRRADEFGLSAGELGTEIKAVVDRKRKMVTDFRSGGTKRLESAGVEIIMGEGSFVGPKQIRIRVNDGKERVIQSDRIFINTGARPRIPDIPGLQGVPYLTSTSIMEVDTLPDHLLILGGGYIGLEFGQMFRRFGSRVTIVERGDQLMMKEDVDIAEEMVKILKEDGIEILLQTSPVTVTKDSDQSINCTVKGPSGENVISCSHIMVAAGRIPNTEMLNLSETGVEMDARGYITTNDRLETNVPGIYALGDVKGGPAFTHISYDDFRVLRTNILEGGASTTSGRLVPYTVFTDPELGRIGMTEKEALSSGRKVRVAKIPMNYSSRAWEAGETRGLLKAVVDQETKQILGCSMLGLQGGELMAMLEIAMIGKVPYTVVKEAIFAHPTLGESLNTLFMSLD
ncbi:MAG: mercuric reductase [Nitrososphaerales archaeon]